MDQRERVKTVVVLSVFAVLFLTLTIISSTGMSVTDDEPPNLTTGYLALKARDYRLDPLHPPFLRMWAALPLLAQRNIKLPARNIDKTTPSDWLYKQRYDEFEYTYRFFYELNNTDHMLYPARFMISLLGVLLGVLVFSWAREWLGFVPAVFALGFYTFEPNILAHSTLVTTDFGITCFIFGSVYFLWRTARRVSVFNLSYLAVFSGLAVVSKFSAIALGPIFLLLLAIRALRATPWPCGIGKCREIQTRMGRAATGAGILLLVGLVSWGTIWAVYGFRYLPSSAQDWVYSFKEDGPPHSLAHFIGRGVHKIESSHLLPNAYSQGFLLQHLNTQGHYAFLAGKLKENGWWYYFPAAFSIKTPVSLILLFLGGLILCAVKKKDFLGNTLFVLVPLVLYMEASISSGMNIGLRHILPIYPFVILLAAFCAAEIMRAKRRIVLSVLGTLCLFWVFEFARVYPHDLAFFNSFIGGPQNGYKYLADSNIDWGQDLKGLKRWMDEKGVNQINLAYFGFSAFTNYGMHCTFASSDRLAGMGTCSTGANSEPKNPPQLPGYVAVSVSDLNGAGLPRADMAFFHPLADRKPSAVIGYSIRVYWVQDRWW